MQKHNCVCVICDKTFYARPCRIRKGKVAYCSNQCRATAQKARPMISNGYRMIYRPEHSNANCHGHVYEHVLVVSKALGRPLGRGEEVHHVNKIRTDNRQCNLIVSTKSYHQWLHRVDRAKGESHGNSKLTEAEVLEIREAEGTQKQIAQNYMVSGSLVGAIKRRVAWAHL